MSLVTANALTWCHERLDDPAEDLAVAALFAPRPLRMAVTAASAIFVEMEGTATRFRELDVARAKLGWWRDELARLDAGRPGHPATRLLASTDVEPPVVALGDLLTGFELILLGGPVNDLATAALRAEFGYARFAFLLAQLGMTDRVSSSPTAEAGVGLGLARILRAPALGVGAREEIARAARDGLAGLAPQLRRLPPPLRILAALAWQDMNDRPQRAPGWRWQSARAFTAWRAAHGWLPRELARA